ncbi:hypothetical protein AVEN_275369-1 [Araneus ventricosus]|uniref:Uncharacterized protein n=1 Tax=Araneus ventricosus TaxID=182803 RepID=A0A4Y2TMY6_ARAVE|nr:hypothetical protein AVEN_275369-1 [Araneus ventricosus]
MEDKNKENKNSNETEEKTTPPAAKNQSTENEVTENLNDTSDSDEETPGPTASNGNGSVFVNLQNVHVSGEEIGDIAAVWADRLSNVLQLLVSQQGSNMSRGTQVNRKDKPEWSNHFTRDHKK